MVIEPPQQLHGHILERQGGAVEQLQQEAGGAQLLQGRDSAVGKGGIGLVAHIGEGLGGYVIADELAHHRRSDPGIGLAGKGGDLGLGEARPLGRDIEAAVRGQAREHGIEESDRRGLAAGRNVAHQGLSLRQSMAA